MLTADVLLEGAQLARFDRDLAKNAPIGDAVDGERGVEGSLITSVVIFLVCEVSVVGEDQLAGRGRDQGAQHWTKIEWRGYTPFTE